MRLIATPEWLTARYTRTQLVELQATAYRDLIHPQEMRVRITDAQSIGASVVDEAVAIYDRANERCGFDPQGHKL